MCGGQDVLRPRFALVARVPIVVVVDGVDGTTRTPNATSSGRKYCVRSRSNCAALLFVCWNILFANRVLVDDEHVVRRRGASSTGGS